MYIYLSFSKMKSKSLVFLLPLFLFTTSCCFYEDDVIDTEPFVDNVADRTIVVYMVGNNSLSSYCKPNIDSIASGIAKSDYRANVLVYEDSKRNRDEADGSDYYSILWDIRRDEKGNVVIEEVWREFAQQSTQPKIMSEVLNKAYDLYPSKEKGLILWSHASGWLPSPDYQTSAVAHSPKLKSFGPDGDDYMEIWDVREALENIPKLDFLCFDACLMANVETIYELKDVADYIVASPTEIWGAGFPYQTVMEPFGQESLNLQKVCEKFMDYYKYRGATISLIKTEGLRDLAMEYKNIHPQFIDQPFYKFSYIQQFGRYVTSSSDFRDIFFDMYDTADKLLSDDIGVETSKQDIMEGLNRRIADVVVFTDHTDSFSTIPLNMSSGLSIYIPSEKSPEKYLSAYSELLWYKDVYEN